MGWLLLILCGSIRGFAGEFHTPLSRLAKGWEISWVHTIIPARAPPSVLVSVSQFNTGFNLPLIMVISRYPHLTKISENRTWFMVVKGAGSRARFISCEDLKKLVRLSVPWFSYLQNGCVNSIHLLECWWGLTKLIHGEHSDKCLTDT